MNVEYAESLPERALAARRVTHLATLGGPRTQTPLGYVVQPAPAGDPRFGDVQSAHISFFVSQSKCRAVGESTRPRPASVLSLGRCGALATVSATDRTAFAVRST